MKISNVDKLVPLIDRVCGLLPYRYDHSVRILMLGTACTESLLVYREQIGGPARGLWQMEPNTAYSIFNDFLRYRRDTYSIVMSLLRDSRTIRDNIKFSVPSKSYLGRMLRDNDEFACIMARIRYAWDKDPIPEGLEDIAKYYKRVYNTPLGKGSADKFIRDYLKLGVELIAKS